ncbi:M48 family metallopeptidase [Halomarina rubra]|uniref:M48 family metallopeptidase n=1 Tax=Halomarina rubra TaxID=2071873 RepID=A0ABD6ASJ1_9EURY|nr:M48 family metalloprotease [Halomarina rubra]
MSYDPNRSVQWPRAWSLYLRLVVALPVLVLLGLATLGVAAFVLILFGAVATIGLYMFGIGPVAVGAVATGATDVDAWGTVEWGVTGGWLLVFVLLLVRFTAHQVRSWLGGVAEWVRSLTDTVDALFPETPTRPVTDERLVATTTALAQQADLPTPDLVVAETETPEALTVGYRPSTTTVVVTDGLLETVGDRELEAVVAHELAHVKNRDAVVMTLVSSVVAGATLLFGFVWGTDRSHDGIDGFAPYVSVVLLPIVFLARAVVALVARVRERAADRGAVALTGDPAGLASALDTLDTTLDSPPAEDLRHEELVALSIVPPPRESVESKLSWERRRPVLWGLRRPVRRAFVLGYRRAYSTHPPTSDRIERLRSLERTAERT